MKEIAKTYNPEQTESKWYQAWLDHRLFESNIDEREPYTIVIPPPNVTGVLHMGHMLNNTLQDILIRRARQSGFNACWVPGMDHASIATEAKVVQMLRAKGIAKHQLTREEFLEHAWEWKEKYGGIILDQLKRLGASCDWSRTKFTMDADMSEAVNRVFVDLYNRGFLYRDLKMVNWDPVAQTTLSNEEVIYREEQSTLYYVRYAIVGTDEFITVATTRPETIPGDTAIAVHPDDERYAHLKNAKARVPMVNREVPIVFDTYIDPEFGTGALKVTPAHDQNDYEIGQKHGLETVDVLKADGTMSEHAGPFVGMDRFEARALAGAELEKEGALVKSETIDNKVGYSERNPDTVVEPRLSMQWFVDMQKLVGPALEHVLNDDIQFVPPKFKNTYRHWMENIRDWPISRQLWWGQQIPAYYLEDGSVIVAETPEQALEQAREKSGNAALSMDALRRDEDVVDTWFSSWLWPISVFDGFNNSEEFNYYYPTNVLVTGWDIIFFWVARMIMAGYAFKGEQPFKDVYFTGMVRDMQRRKMSKSLGNSPDALGLIDTYGADGVRVGMLLSSAAGNDLLFDEKLCEQGRNFSNKIWNAFRLVAGWSNELSDEVAPEYAQQAIHLFEQRMNSVFAEIDGQFESYRLSEALMAIYKLIWDDFCSNYLEMVKPIYGQKMDASTHARTVQLFERLLEVLHPFMPFITEEIWQGLQTRGDGEFLTSAQRTSSAAANADAVAEFDKIQQIVTELRNLRQSKQISPKTALNLAVVQREKPLNSVALLTKLAVLESYATVDEAPAGSLSFRVGTDEFFVPLEGSIDWEAEKEKIQKELDYLRGFLQSVERKLTNERFVNNAPADVVENERAKQRDAKTKIEALESQLEQI